MSNRRATARYPMLLPQEQESRVIDDDRLSLHVLDGAIELPEMALEGLPLVAQALSANGAVVVVEYDDVNQCLRFYSQNPWLPAGRLSAARDYRCSVSIAPKSAGNPDTDATSEPGDQPRPLGHAI